MKDSFLVCIIGIDGSGKTTHARELAKYLASKGMNVKYSYGRYVPILTRPLVRIGAFVLERRTRERRDARDFSAYTNEKKRVLGKPIMRRLVYHLITSEYLLQLAIKILVPMRFGRSIVSDRYIHDTVATDLAPNLGFDNAEIQDSINRLLEFVPEPSVIIYLKVRPEVAYARKSDIDHVDYLKEREAIYNLIAKSYNAQVVDGEKEQPEVQCEIQRIVERSLTMG